MYELDYFLNKHISSKKKIRYKQDSHSESEYQLSFLLYVIV